MADFSYLKKTKRPTSEMTLWDVMGKDETGADKESVLIVRSAGEDNKPYYNEVLRRADHYAKRKVTINAAMIDANRESDYVLYPKYVIVGWKNVVDGAGKAVPFSTQNCEDYLRAVGHEVFADVIAYCRDSSNFYDAPVDGSAAAGNSPTA